MRFLCVSDQIDPLVYSTGAKERYKDIDAVFCAGDLPFDYIDFIVDAINRPTFFVFGNHNLTELKYYKKQLQDIRTAVDFDSEALNRGHGAVYVSNKCVRYRKLSFTLPNGKKTPLLICGVNGSRRYNNGPDQFTEGQMLRQLLKLTPSLLWNRLRYGRYCDVFLTHAAPRHIHDMEDPCHKGFKCFNWFIKRFAPALLIHGHIHLYDLNAERCTLSGKTLVVNAYSRVVLDYKPEFGKEGGGIPWIEHH